MKTKINLIASLALIAAAPLGHLAHATDASQDLSRGAASIAASPLASIEGNPLNASLYFVLGAFFIVVGIGTAVGDTVSVILQNTVDGSKAVVRVAATTAKEIGIVAGSGIKVATASTGYALIASGRVLAFVPNAIGKELLYQSKLSK